MRSTRTEGGPTPLTRTGPARLLLADDHGLVRAGLRHMLSREQDLEVVGEAKNGLEAVQLCRRLGVAARVFMGHLADAAGPTLAI